MYTTFMPPLYIGGDLCPTVIHAEVPYGAVYKYGYAVLPTQPTISDCMPPDILKVCREGLSAQDVQGGERLLLCRCM